MDYEWDPRKAATNLRKYGIDFADAVTMFSDDSALTIEDAGGSETRFVILGMDAFARILVVIFAWRGERIRLISARRATPSERKQYGRGQ